MLRDFLYLNHKLVGQFLAQLEGGVFDEETERTSQTGKGGFSGALHAPVAELKGEKGRESTSENERIMRQTPESQFNRLYDYLNKDDMLSVDEISDPAFVSGLKQGPFWR